MRRRFFVSYKDHTIAFDINNYLTIEALADNLVVQFDNAGCEYCVDGDGNWKSLTSNTNTESINKGQTLSFKRNINPNSYGIGTFTISKKCNLKGNCMSMLFGDNAANNHSLSGKETAFYQLFYNCSNIVTVSDNFLPATTLADECYTWMFRGCSSLTTAPELPATILADYCYYGMFTDCSKLNYIKMLATNISASSCLSNWVSGVSSIGTFVKNPSMTSLPTGKSGIPSGWTVVNDGEDSGNLITFTVNGIEYQAEEGMTWGEFINSEYNKYGYFTYNSYNQVKYNGIEVSSRGSSEVIHITDLILENGSYMTHNGGAN